MGYYTTFRLSAVAGTPIEDIPDFADTFQNITSYIFQVVLYDIKWYSTADDMKRISLIYPNTVFRLSWSGEDYDDQGIAYYWNGKATEERLLEIVEPKLTNLPGFAEAHPELLL